MTPPPDPDALKSILKMTEEIVRRAFNEGYRIGSQDAADKMMRAVNTTTSSDVRYPTTLAQSGNGVGNRPVPIGQPLAQARQYQYGTVIGTIREGVLACPDTGMTVDDMIAYCRSRGLDVTPNAVRDTIKRLRGGEELERHHGAYFPGPRLRSKNGDARPEMSDLLGGAE
jgi:hypothetical protein